MGTGVRRSMVTGSTVVGCLLATLVIAHEKQSLTVRAISHEMISRDSNGRSISCYGNNCTVSGGFEWVEITQRVEATGMLYTLSCSGVPFRSLVYRHCEWLHFDGDSFRAEIKGQQMTVFARSGGNQGKELKLKFQIADIRPVPSDPSEK